MPVIEQRYQEIKDSLETRLKTVLHPGNKKLQQSINNRDKVVSQISDAYIKRLRDLEKTDPHMLETFLSDQSNIQMVIDIAADLFTKEHRIDASIASGNLQAAPLGRYVNTMLNRVKQNKKWQTYDQALRNTRDNLQKKIKKAATQAKLNITDADKDKFAAEATTEILARAKKFPKIYQNISSLTNADSNVMIALLKENPTVQGFATGLIDNVIGKATAYTAVQPVLGEGIVRGLTSAAEEHGPHALTVPISRVDEERRVRLVQLQLKLEKITDAIKEAEKAEGGPKNLIHLNIEQLTTELSITELEIEQIEAQARARGLDANGCLVFRDQERDRLAELRKSVQEKSNKLSQARRQMQLVFTDTPELQHEQALAKKRALGEVALESATKVFLERGTAIVLPAMRSYAQSRNSNLIGILHSDDKEHAEGMQTFVKQAIREAEGTSITPVPPTISAGKTEYKDKGTTLVTHTEDQDGNITFKIDPTFSGILMVERMKPDGTPDPEQLDIVEYKNGKPIAVCAATEEKSSIKNINFLKAQTELGISSMEHSERGMHLSPLHNRKQDKGRSIR